MRLSKPFIPLPFSFDAEKLKEEVLSLPPEAWMSHPSGFDGNSAVPLVSIGAGNNQLFNGGMKTTPHLARCPYTAQVMGTLGEVLGRSRFMKLTPGAEVSAHVDGDYHWNTHVRVHVPVITHPSVDFHCGEHVMNMKEGDCWIFDTWQLHKVENNSPHDRIHLVFDLSGSSRFWNMVEAMSIYDHTTAEETLAAMRKHIPYQEGAAVALQTENYNVCPIMAPGEMELLIEELIADFDGNPANLAELEANYKHLLRDFSKDWRQVWHVHGYEEAGWPHYEALARGLMGRIDRRNHNGVLLKSNNASANIVILKRLVQPAINREVFDELKARGSVLVS